jgi:hypothetical protein
LLELPTAPVHECEQRIEIHRVREVLALPFGGLAQHPEIVIVA